MRAGPVPVDGAPVVVGTATVHGTGQVIPLHGVDFSRSIGGAGMPSEIDGGGSSRAARATLTVAPAGWADGSTSRPGTPWRPEEGLPLPDGSLVTVALGENGVTYPVITRGVVVSEAGSMKDPMTIIVEDTLDGLSGRVSWPYLRSAMPPSQSAPSAYRNELRRVGLSHWSLLERAFRASGNGTTPPAPDGGGVVVPLVDTAWPERGTCYRARSYGSADQQAGFITDSNLGSRVLTDGNMIYAPSGTVGGTSRYVSFQVGPSHGGAFLVVLQVTGGAVSVRVSGTRMVEVYSSVDTNAKHTRALGASDTWVHVRYSTDGTTNIRTASINENGTIPVTGLSGNVTQVAVSAVPGARVNGLTVSGVFHATELAAWSRPTTYSPSPTISAALTDAPRVHDEDALRQIADIADAACLGFWRDAQGIYRVTSPDHLPSTPSRRTLTPASIEGLSWSRERHTARRRVVLHGQMPMSGSRLVPSITLWQSSGEALARGHERVDVVQIPADEDWVVCTETHRTGDPIGSTVWGDPDRGQGTIVGGWAQDVSDWARDKLTTTLTSSPSAGLYVFTSTTVVAQMALGESIVLATAPMDNTQTTLPTRYRDADLPILRGWATCQWVEGEVLSGTVGLRPRPDLVHDISTHVQTGAQALADYLASRLVPTDPGNPGLVVLDGILIRPDWRLECGDMVTIEDSAWMELRLQCLITGISSDVSAGDAGMTLTVQVTEGESLAYTYGDADNYYVDQARKYAELDAASSTTDYAGLSAEPLR